MAREKFPDLIGLSPKKQLDGLPPLPKSKCGKRNRSCSAHGGGCGYRFKKGDKHWICPKCGADRRCWSNKVSKKKACRMHGANGGRPKKKTYAIYRGLEGFNELLADPDLLNNRMQITTLELIAEDLAKELFEHDQSALLDDLNKALRMIAGSVRVGNMSRLQAGLDMAMEAASPLTNARDLRREIYENYKLAGILKAQESKRVLDESGMIPAAVVWEFIGLNQRLMFQFIPSSTDRTAYMRELRSMVPEPPDNGSASKSI